MHTYSGDHNKEKSRAVEPPVSWSMAPLGYQMKQAGDLSATSLFL
jgi:hypothetical protein